MGRGLPVAMHSRMALWWRDAEMFWGPVMMRGLWGSTGLRAAEREVEGEGESFRAYGFVGSVKMPSLCCPFSE